MSITKLSVSDLYKGTDAEERIRAEIDSEIKKEELQKAIPLTNPSMEIVYS